MADLNPKLLIDVSSSRDLDVRIFGTSDSLRFFATSLLSAIDSLPSPLTDRQKIFPKVGFGDAKGSKRETYLYFCAEPSLDYLPRGQKRRAVQDFIFCIALFIFVAFAFIGVATVWHWIK